MSSTAAGTAGTDQPTDLVFRPPLPLDNCCNLGKDHDEQMGPRVSALLVACQVLRLSEETTFAAGCLLHRYYCYQLQAEARKDEERKQFVLVACIFLATKAQEEPRRLRDFINISQMLSWKDKSVATKSDSTSSVHNLEWKSQPPALDESYWKFKERIVEIEQHVLRWLAFDVHVSHAHRAVVALVQQQQTLSGPVQTQIVQRASYLLNHAALYSSQALAIPVVSLATAAIQLTSFEMKLSPDIVWTNGKDDSLVAQAQKHMRQVLERFSGCCSSTANHTMESSMSTSQSNLNQDHSFEAACAALFGPLHNQGSASLQATKKAQERRPWTVHDMRAHLQRLATSQNQESSPLLPFLPSFTQSSSSTSSTSFPKIIHITGTKGKGSTAVMCESLCRHVYGLKTGLFTSPHLCDIRERIRINGELVSKQQFALAYWTVRRALQADDNDNDTTLPGYFRMLTLMAWYIFTHLQNPPLDVIVLEVGMGGRYDATNFIDLQNMDQPPKNGQGRPFVCGVTLIDYDHVRVLGDTLEKIAWEKGGIFKLDKVDTAYVTPRPGTKPNNDTSLLDTNTKHNHKSSQNTFFALESNTPSVIEVLKQCANNEGRGSALELVGPTATDHLLPFMPQEMGLVGAHQTYNALLAVAMVRYLMGDVSTNDEKIALSHKALSTVSWPGRCQTVQVSESMILRIDGAHTRQSIQAGIDWFQQKQRQTKLAKRSVMRALIFYCSHEKNPVPLLEPLFSVDNNDMFDIVCFCKPYSERPSAIAKKSAVQLLRESGHLPSANNTTKDSTPTESDQNWGETLMTLWKHLNKSFPHKQEVMATLNVEQALQYLQQQVDETSNTVMEVFVVGSLYLAGSVLERIGGSL